MEGLKIKGHGGPGRGQGRKPTGRKKVVYYITEVEAARMSSLLHHIREGNAQYELPGQHEEADAEYVIDLTEILQPTLENERETVRRLAAMVSANDIDAIQVMVSRAKGRRY